MGMGNSSKDKGDRNERAAVVELVAKAGDLTLPNAQRKLGAGRREDTGDLHVFPDVAVQVRAKADLGDALRTAAVDSVVQAGHGGMAYALGMVPVPQARQGTVRWLACCLSWPGGAPGADEIAVFAQPTRAVAHLRREDLGVPRVRRIVQLARANAGPVFVAPIEAWLAAYRLVRSSGGERLSAAAHVQGVGSGRLAVAG